jgi:hypothetical protein
MYAALTLPHDRQLNTFVVNAFTAARPGSASLPDLPTGPFRIVTRLPEMHEGGVYVASPLTFLDACAFALPALFAAAAGAGVESGSASPDGSFGSCASCGWEGVRLGGSRLLLECSIFFSTFSSDPSTCLRCRSTNFVTASWHSGLSVM